MNPFYRAIARAISDASGRAFDIRSIAHLGGGCINETVKLLGTDGTAWFLKSNTAADTTVFAAEFDGLKSLAATNTLRVPQPLCFGEAEGQAWFVMEFLDLGESPRLEPEASTIGARSLTPPPSSVLNGGENSLKDPSPFEPLNLPAPPLPVPLLHSEWRRGTGRGGAPVQGGGGSREGALNSKHERSGSPQERLGRELAALHRIPQPHFGWHRDNTIGSTPQMNPRSDEWIAFWREHRLGYQLELARKRGATFPGADQLLDQFDDFFTGYDPQPSLLHGDLWSGNVGFLADGTPVVFDPACYFGDREAEFGIIEMFGGFTDEFYRGYHSVWPLDQGFQHRLPLYELYHTLNHFNLFGGGYAAGCQRLIDQLLRGIRL